MDSATSKSVSHPPKLVTARRATRIMPLERGHGILLVATCLLNALISQISVSEIYKWLAKNYLHY
jgi:hypothetical protein